MIIPIIKVLRKLIYLVRKASKSDLTELSIIEREAFTENWPPTPFKRDLENSNVEILVVSVNVDSGIVVKEPQIETISEKSSGYSFRFLSKWKAFWNNSSKHDDKDIDIVGYIAIRQMYDEAHITSIAVRESFRGIGIGELLLMSGIFSAMCKNCRNTTLEVRVSNKTAYNLYSKYGFNEMGIRKRYYTDNNEDAYIMTTDVLSSESYAAHFNKLVYDFKKRTLNINWNINNSYPY